MTERAAVVAIEVDSKQKYLFESDKLREIVGASRLMAALPDQARAAIKDLGLGQNSPGVHLFQPLSGDVRLWSPLSQRAAILTVAWKVREWLGDKGIEHTAAYFECEARHFESESERRITAEERSTDKEPIVASLSWVNARLTRHLAARKNAARCGDARPTNSFFAPCQIFGSDFANHWQPSRVDREDEPRRCLVGHRARAKLQEREGSRDRFYNDHLTRPIGKRLKELANWTPAPGRPITFRDLADERDPTDRDDGFIAFHCADADGLGSILPLIPWNGTEAQWVDRREPWKRNRDFVLELDRCVKEAFHEAVVHVAVPDEKSAGTWVKKLEAGKALTLPVLPQLLGGDDLWTVSRKEIALPLATAFISNFARMVDQDTPLLEDRQGNSNSVRVAVRLARAESGEVAEPGVDGDRVPSALCLTMSVGVAFGKQGHPAYAMAEAAEELLGNAKQRRKGQMFRVALAKPEGCIDWHVIESSLVETVNAARDKGWRYSDPPIPSATRRDILLLTTRPWTVSEAARFMEAAALWIGPGDEGVARRKREQIEDILRRGSELSVLAWQAWWKRLKEKERAVVETVHAGLPAGMTPSDDKHLATTPWRVVSQSEASTQSPTTQWLETPFLDLLALGDVIEPRSIERTGGSNADAQD